MASTTNVKIIMPSFTIFEAKASLVMIPGGDGMLGVLPNHMKLISTIQIGIVSIFVDQLEHKFFINGGLVQIKRTEVNIVTEFALSINGQTKVDILNKLTTLKLELENHEKTSLAKNTLEINILKDYIAMYNDLLRYV